MPGIPDQYRIVLAGAGWRRRTERGRLRVTGADRVSFLHALVTNDLASLAARQGAYAAYLTPQGRMIADLHVFVRSDHVMADVPAIGASRLAEAFDRLVFAEDVRIEDVSGSTCHFTVAGGEAAAVLARALDVDAGDLRGLSTWSQLDLTGGFVTRSDAARIDTYDIVLPATGEANMAREFEHAGISPLSGELAESLRIDAGRPAFGIDMDTETIPLEAGLLDRAISTTKGCYVGQEVVIRVLHRGGGRVARKLMKLSMDDPSALIPSAGTLLTIDGREVGRITSAAHALDGAGVVALGYVHRDAAEIGQEVTIASSPPALARLVAFAG